MYTMCSDERLEYVVKCGIGVLVHCRDLFHMIMEKGRMLIERTVFYLLESISIHIKDSGGGQGRSVVTVVTRLRIQLFRQ